MLSLYVANRSVRVYSAVDVEPHNAYSRLRLVKTPLPDDLAENDGASVTIYAGDFDRLDGRPEGLYAATLDIHVWWHAEDANYEVPPSEIAELQARITRAASERGPSRVPR
jgi:hypothetical protein